MFESMKKLVSGSLGKTGENARRITAAIVLEKAAAALVEVFGEEAGSQMVPSVFKEGRLTVSTRHAVWAQELKLRQPEAIGAVNRHLGGHIVSQLIIR